MTEHDPHSSPIKTPKQLAVVVVLAFVVPVTLIVLISQLVTGRPHESGGDAAVLARIAPVGTVQIAAPSGPKGMLTGEQVFAQTCKTCHEAGIAGAHKVGDKASWAKVLAQGDKLTFQHAIAGLRAMPARGGNPDLTDDEVKRGVVYMVNQSGGKWTAPPVAAPTATAAATPAAAPAAPTVIATAAAQPVAVAPAAAAAPAKPDGKKVFEGTCSVCHGAGIAGAPKFGDKAAWAPRIAQGTATLYNHALNGLTGKGGVMPPKGGNTSLSDAEVKAAVDYMVAAAK